MTTANTGSSESIHCSCWQKLYRTIFSLCSCTRNVARNKWEFGDRALRNSTIVATIDCQRPKVHFMFERCIKTDLNTTDTRPGCPSNVNLVYTKHAKSSVRNSIWRFIGSNANFTCPPSSMRKLHYIHSAATNVDALVAVPRQRSVFFFSQLPIVRCSRFADSLLAALIIDHRSSVGLSTGRYEKATSRIREN